MPKPVNAHASFHNTMMNGLIFIVGNRLGQDLWKEYDYIEGGVANDRVVDTIDLYMTGFIPRFEAIERLKYLRPNNQICISSQILIDKYLFSRIVL